MPIYDLTYRRIEGVRPAGRFRFLPITRAGLVLFFRRRIYVVLGLFALAPFFLMIVPLAAPHLIEQFRVSDLPPEIQRFLHLNPESLFVYLTKFQWVFVFLFALLTGGGLIANDLRANALEIYFSRPITVWDYFLGKLFVVWSVLLAMTLLPSLLLWIIDVSLAIEDRFWVGQLHLLPRIVGAAICLTLPYALLALACSTVAKSARGAMLLFAGVERVLALVSGKILAQVLHEPAWGLLSFSQPMERLAAAALGPDPELVRQISPSRQGIPLVDVPLWMPSAVLGGVCVACALIVLRRVRGVEVVKG